MKVPNAVAGVCGRNQLCNATMFGATAVAVEATDRVYSDTTEIESVPVLALTIAPFVAKMVRGQLRKIDNEALRVTAVSSTPSLNLNAEKHPLAFEGKFGSLDEYLNHLMHLRAYEELLPLVQGRKVLDLGCNNGYGTNHIRSACAEIVGVDVSTSAVQDGLARFGQSGLRLEVYDGRNLPFPDATFDVVVSLQVIEHIDLDLVPAYLDGAVRVLKPGGTAVFTTPNGTVRVAPGARPWNAFHVREFSAGELRDELLQHFEGVEILGMFGSPPVHQRVLASYRAAQSVVSRRSWRDSARERFPWLVPIVHRIHKAQARLSMKSIDFSAYSTADLRYTANDLSEALDLLAFCRKGGLPGNGQADRP